MLDLEDQIERAIQSDNPVKYVMDLYDLALNSPLFEGRRMEMIYFCHDVSKRVEEILRKSPFFYE